ncbi:hypothetical protein IWX84_000293 [Flavobacterium sp. CG_9.10]|nr:hypothetical protein [Flavobacterium sp. CG_9.10]
MLYFRLKLNYMTEFTSIYRLLYPAKIRNTKSLQVTLNNKLISGTYFIQIKTETDVIKKQIILNR